MRIHTVLLLTLVLPAPAAADTTVTYLHGDLAGSPVVATDETGVVLWQEEYRPFGERTLDEAAAVDQSTWLTGHVEDRSTGLVYMGARYYDPLIGRFLGIDPAAVDENQPHSFNRYAYANNNPYRYLDPDGNTPVAVGVAVGAGLNVGINYAITRWTGEEYTLGTFVFDAVTGGVGLGAIAKVSQWAMRLLPKANTAVESAETVTVGVRRFAGHEEFFIGNKRYTSSITRGRHQVRQADETLEYGKVVDKMQVSRSQAKELEKIVPGESPSGVLSAPRRAADYCASGTCIGYSRGLMQRARQQAGSD